MVTYNSRRKLAMLITTSSLAASPPQVAANRPDPIVTVGEEPG